VVTGIPLRRAVATLDRATLRGEAAVDWDLDPSMPTLLVFGGSQGSVQINAAVAGAVTALVERGIQVLHATGPDNPIGTGDAPGYRAVPYLDHVERAYAVADLVLCRSGAMTCAELAAVGLPAVYVPYPHSNGEQELNAKPIVRVGGGVVVPDGDLTADRLLSEVVPLLVDPVRLDLMSKAAATLGLRDADEALVDLTLSAAGWTE
jgi:UDP-N-acetylglucosamine--N-acetylmuramyl-(pentapeptide) pyrophosphoryl-undecaprenol N-acetylglucosamine transferase